MSVRYNEDSIPGRHTLTYRTRDYDRGNPVRMVEVLATPEEIATLVRDGYLVRKNLVPMEEVERLRAALDQAIQADRHLESSGGRSFGGIFIRHLMDKHPAFLEMLNFPPTVSIARALFGPAVQMRGYTGRVCYPDKPNQETEWHFHQRIVPDPIPPFFARSHTLDVLLYLDDIDERNGPLCVVPGSHHRIEEDLQKGDFEDKPGQVVLQVPAGSCVLTHGSLWHRSLPTQPGCTIRRLLLFGYSAAWIKPSIYGVRPPDGLTAQLIDKAAELDTETRELLGLAGFM